jgi:glycosyltransferase involved in cell wall biosynthesis
VNKKINIFIGSYYFSDNVTDTLIANRNSYISGPSVDLYDFLLTRSDINNIVYFRYPLLSKSGNSKLILEGRINNNKFFHVLPVVKLSWYKSEHQSFFQTIFFKLGEIYYLTRSLKKYSEIKFDYVWTTESIQLLVAKIFFFRNKEYKLLYDVIDYSPKRFPSKVKNFFFHFLDNIACRLSDYSIVQTYRVIKYRKRKKILKKNQIIKATGVQEKFFLNSKIFNQNNIVYAGVLSKSEGLDLILDNFEEIVKINPKIKLNIVGTTQDEAYLNEFLIKVNLFKKYINYLGPIHDKHKLSHLLSEQGIGIALYNREKKGVSNKFFNSVNKLHMYGSCSLPVITTNITMFSKEIKLHEAGYVINFNKKDLLESFIKFFSLSENDYYNLRQRSYNLSKNSTWEKIFYDFFLKIGLQ